ATTSSAYTGSLCRLTQTGSAFNLSCACFGGVPSKVTFPLTAAVPVAGSKGVAAPAPPPAAGASDVAGASSFLPQATAIASRRHAAHIMSFEFFNRFLLGIREHMMDLT